MITQDMAERRFDFIKDDDKQFIIEYTHTLENLGFTYGDEIGSGFCWGKYMLIFRKAHVKSKNVVARIYITNDSIILRMFFQNVTKHASYISTSSDVVKQAFIGEHGTCKHCKGDHCKFRKDYEIDGIAYEKCNGTTFEFYDPKLADMEAYVSLFNEFYPPKKKQT